MQSKPVNACPTAFTRPQSQQRSLDIVVGDEAEGEAAQLLVRALYASDEGVLLAGLQLALLRVLRLVDRLQALRCIAAAATALAAVPALEWATAVWQLPDGCADQPAYAAVFGAAAKPAQARLGDLDVALADEGCRTALLALPLHALAQVLRSDATRASSENVVFYACSAWLGARGGGGEEEQRALAGCLRLHRMSPLYLATVVGQADWVPRAALAAATGFAAMPFDVQVLLTREHPELKAPPRPASRVAQGVIE